MSQLAELDKEIRLKRNTLRWPLRAKVVLENYRLNAEDLQNYRAARQRYIHAQVINVSLEGVEELSVLLHLEGLSKPLRLTYRQRQELADLFQSRNFADWIGQTLTLTISKSSYHSKNYRRTEGNHIELSLAADNSKVYSARPPHDASTDREPAAAANHSFEPEEASRTSTPHNHFSGIGQEYSMSDSSVDTALGYSGLKRPTRSMLPSWLQDVSQLALIKETRLLLGPNLIVALLIFLLIIAVVNFERIVNLFVSLLP